MSAGDVLMPTASTERPSKAPYRKLSPGPGRAAHEVAAHQRARMHAAMIEIVGEEGYDAVTVRQLARLAGVSTKAFYVHFEGKEECCLRAYEAVVRGAVERIGAAQVGVLDWLEQLERAFNAFAQEIEARSHAARFALVEIFCAGPAGLERMRCTESIFESMIADSLGRAPGDIQVPPLLMRRGIVAGLSCIARSRLLAGQKEQDLPDLAGEMLGWVLSFHDETVADLGKLDCLATNQMLDRRAMAPSEKVWTPEDERQLILSAVAKLSFSHGYRQLTIQRICVAAGVRRKSFDANFKDVADCFLTAVKLRAFKALESVATSIVTSGWPAGVDRATAALCERIARDPQLAKLVFVEVLATGKDGVRCRGEITRAIAERFRLSAPPGQDPGELAAEASVGAIWGILERYVASGRAQQLHRLVPLLSFMALAPAMGPPMAATEVLGARIAT